MSSKQEYDKQTNTTNYLSSTCYSCTFIVLWVCFPWRVGKSMWGGQMGQASRMPILGSKWRKVSAAGNHKPEVATFAFPRLHPAGEKKCPSWSAAGQEAGCGKGFLCERENEEKLCLQTPLSITASVFPLSSCKLFRVMTVFCSCLYSAWNRGSKLAWSYDWIALVLIITVIVVVVGQSAKLKICYARNNPVCT